MPHDRHIFAMGNNPFLKGGENLRLFRHILSHTQAETPRVLFIPTASGDAQSQIDAFKACFSRLNCNISVLSLFRGETEDLESLVLNQDLIYVSGGNTRNLMVLWKEWKLDQLIHRAYQKGIIMAGGSAGSLCWFEEGVTDSIPQRLTAMKCMGILKGSNCPHYDGEIHRRPSYHALLKAGELKAGFANEDAVALHFVNETLHEAVSEIEGKKAYFVEFVHDAVRETPFDARSV